MNAFIEYAPEYVLVLRVADVTAGDVRALARRLDELGVADDKRFERSIQRVVTHITCRVPGNLPQTSSSENAQQSVQHDEEPPF